MEGRVLGCTVQVRVAVPVAVLVAVLVVTVVKKVGSELSQLAQCTPCRARRGSKDGLFRPTHMAPWRRSLCTLRQS
jgi:hypothetical protein